MKKNLGVGEGRTGLSRMRMAAVAGCLLILGGLTGAAAQSKLFDVDHAVTGLTGWSDYDNKLNDNWDASSKAYVVVKNAQVGLNDDGNDAVKFLTNNTACKGDGKYMVKFSRFAAAQLSLSGGIVFRFKDKSHFYYLTTSASSYDTYNKSVKVFLFKNRVFLGSKPESTSTGYRAEGTFTHSATAPEDYEFEIVLTDKTIKVNYYKNGSLISTPITYTDPDADANLDGDKVGYASLHHHNVTPPNIRYVSSSWTSSEVAAEKVPTAYAGYYVWNKAAGKKFTGGNGNWSDASWSKDSSTVTPVLWPAGSNALFFAAPSGTITASGQSVGNMAFTETGYVITGDTLKLGAAVRTIKVDASAATIRSVLSGTGAGITKDGTGQLTLGASNAYTGATTISAGTLIAASNNALGTGAVTVSGSSAILQIGTATGTGTVTLPNAITASGASGGIISEGAGNAINGAITLSGTTAVSINVKGTNLTLPGAITGGAGIAKTGTGTLTLTNASYTIPISVATGGKIAFSSTGAISSSGGISGTGTGANAGVITKEGSGTLTLFGTNNYPGTTEINGGGISISTGSDIGNGAITLATGTTLTLNNPAAVTAFGKTVSGAGTFVKSGAGELTFAAAANITAKKTEISAGTVNASTALKSDSIVVASAGTLKYDGTAALSLPGALIVNGTLNLPLGGLNATTPKITATGALVVGAAAKLNITGTVAVGKYVIAKGASGSGDFSTITVNGSDNSGYRFTTARAANQIELTIAEKGGSENDVKPYVTVDSAKYTGDGAAGSNVTLYLSGSTGSGLQSMRTFIAATSGARITSVWVLYNPGAAATVNAGVVDTTKNGGRIEIPLSAITASTGNSMTFTLTVPAAKNSSVEDSYYFNVATYWSIDGTATATPSVSNNKSAYLRDPKNAVKENKLELSIVGNQIESDATGITLRLNVKNPDILPGSASVGENMPYVDNVGIWVKRNGPAPALTGNKLDGAVAGFEKQNIIPVATLKSQPNFDLSLDPIKNPSADTLYFAIAPHWTSAVIDSVARPLVFIQRTLIKEGKPMPNNTVTLSAVQKDKRKGEVSITLGLSAPLNEHAVTVVVELSFNSSMTPVISKKTLSANEADGYEYPILSDEFVGAERQVYYNITVLDADNLGPSTQGSFKVGRTPPTPVTGFTAEAGAGGSMELSWGVPTAQGNNLGDVGKAVARIYSSVSAISAGVDTSNSALKFETQVKATDAAATISNLMKEKDYWFAITLLDVVDASKPEWTLASPTAVCMNNTGTGNVVSNILTIDTVTFNSAATTFTVTVKLTEDNTSNYKYGYVVTVGADTVLASDAPKEFGDSRKDRSFQFTTEGVGDALMFDTVYRVHVYVVDAMNYASSKKFKDVRIGSFTQQTVLVPAGGSGSANNGNFKLDAGEWLIKQDINATVKASDTPSEVNIDRDGFIPVGSYGYKYTVAASNYLDVLGQFKISLRANDEIPPPYEPKDVKIYRWNESAGYWEVSFDTKYEDGYFTGTAVDSVMRDTDKTYRLLINTLGGKPTVTSSGYQEVVSVGESINANYTVSSNVGNYKVKVVSGPAKGSGALTEENLGTPTGGRVSFTITDGVVRESENSGVIAFIIVNDGSAEHAENVSYRVKSTKYRGFPADPVPKKWLPFASQVDLENKSVRPALGKFYQEGDSFTVYDTLFRLFRWHETRENRGDKNKWVEYNGRNDSTFNMAPTQLMWFKTSVASVLSELDFGGSVSVPLRNAFDITLPAKQWTDLVLPFSFKVCLGDVLDATADASGASNLEIYRWRPPTGKNQKYSYVAEALSLAAADSSLELDGEDEPFTVYNPGNSAVILRIPPQPAFLSRYNKDNKKKPAQALAKAAANAQQAGGGAWHYTLNAAADGSELSNVLVGYSPTERVFAVPPGFGNESVVLVGDNGDEIGHHFGPSIASGRTYKLRFYNDGKQRTAFTFSAKQSANAPAGARVTFVKASTGELLGGGNGSEQSITVAGMSHEDVFMIVGNSGYRAKAASVKAGAKFTIDRISVNKSARSARITYYVPESGVNQVEVSIYDIRGRQVWKTAQKVNAAAWNAIEWNSRASKRNTASTGLYVVRVKAMGPGGRTVGADTKRIMFSR